MLTNIPYQNIFKLTPFPTVLLSAHGQNIIVLEANLAYLNLIDSSATSIIGKNFISLLDSTKFQPFSLEIKKSVDHVLKTKEKKSIRLTLKNLEIQHTPILAENGDLQFIVHTVKPIDTQQTAEKLISLILMNTEEGFILLNKDLLITSFNEKSFKLYQTYFGIDIVEGESILAYANNSRLELQKKLYQNVLDGNVEHSIIDIAYQKENKRISIKYSPITNEHQQIIGVFVTASDITAITNFEVQLKTREQELSLIYDNLVEMVFLLSVEENKRSKFISVNKAFTLASGFSDSEIIGKYVEEIIPEPSLSMMLREYKQATSSKGNIRWEEISSNPAGKKTGIVSINPIFDDFTDRVIAEHDKQKAYEQLNKIMDSSLDVICTISKEHKFVTVSAAAERLWGYRPEELVGNAYSDFVYEEDLSLTKKFSELIMQGLETSNFENRYVKKDGTIVHNIWSARWDKIDEIIYCTAKDGTDRIKSEKYLQESEQRFKCLVQDGSDLIGILDSEGNYNYVSPTSMAVLGMLPEEFIGKNAFDFVHPEDVERLHANFSNVGIEKRVALSPFRFKHKNGTWRWIETVATDLLNEPAIKGIVTNSRDVTDKIDAQRTILLSNERYKYVTKATSDAIWDWDIATNELYWGEGFQFLFGYQPGILTADIGAWSDKIHVQDVERTVESMHAVINSAATNWIAEYLYLKANGEYAYVLDKGFVIRDEHGNAIRMVGAMQDISRHKMEEQQLKLLESVITNATDSVLITEAEPIDDPGPLILYANDAFTKMTGYTADEVIGKSPRILQGPKTDKAELARLKEHLRNWQPYEATLVNYKKNGEEFWINFSITPVADEKGWFTHWISIERDVTEWKNREIQKRLLSDISQLFHKTASLTETLSKVLQTIYRVGNYCMLEIWLVDKEKQELNLITKHWVSKQVEHCYDETNQTVKFKYGEGLPGKVWKSELIQLWDLPITDRTNITPKTEVLKGIGVPLFNNDELSGVLVLGEREKGDKGGFSGLSDNFGKHLGAEIKRKQIEQELNQLFNFAPDIITISNFEGQLKKVNPATCRLLEYSEKEFLNQPIANFLHPDDRKNAAHQININQIKSETYYFENRYITKSGRIKWLAWASNAIAEEGLIFSVAKDITDEKNLADLLLKSNSMGKVGSWEIDVIGGTVYWSDITREIRETEPGFVPALKTGIHHFKEGRDKETITKKVNECKAKGTPWDEELQIVTFKGNLKWIRTIGQAEMVNGKCIRIYGSFQDIDQRKKAELKVAQAVLDLEESEKRYSDLFHLSPLSMWVFDVETLRFLDVNQTAQKNYGYSYDEFLSMTIRDIMPPAEIINLEGALKISSESGGLSYEGIFIHQNKRGEELHVEIKSNLILFKGKIAKVIVANDISERITYYNALEQQNKKLQEISWIQSHIVRAPLARLMGLIYLLKDKNVQTELSEKSIIDHIEHSAEELDQRIREIIEKSDQK